MKKNKIKRIYHNYNKWEDYHSGLYKIILHDDNLVNKSKILLSNEEMFYYVARCVVFNWPISCEQNLTDKSRNRKAWLGQASCCILFDVPENLTKQAWHQLTESQQNEANKIAEKIIKQWELDFIEKANRKCQKPIWE